MGESRRVRIFRAFFAIWFAAIFAESLNYFVLGDRVGPWVFFKPVFFVGLCWQVIFQGPSGLEVMERMCRTGERNCSLDHLYLAFTLDRTVRVVVVLSLLAVGSSLSSFVSGRAGLFLAGLAVLIALVAVCRVMLMRLRVLAGRFGTNQYEARELLAFLKKMYDTAPMRFEPPSGLKHLHENMQLEAPPNAELAL